MQNVNLLNLFLAKENVLPWTLVGVLAVLAIASSVVCWFLGAKLAKKKAQDEVEFFFEDEDDDDEDDEDDDELVFVADKRDMEELFVKVLRLTVEIGTISISLIQRRFRLGYSRAGAIVDKMEQLGYVSSSDGSKVRRVLITKEQFEEKYGPIKEDETLTNIENTSVVEDEGTMDNLFVEALRLAVNTGSISISFLQRRFQTGYSRAGAIVDNMEKLGYVSANEGAKARRVLITKEQFEEKYGPL